MVKNRKASFVIVTLVYILAAAAGIVIYRALSFDWWLNLLIADVAATVLTFVFSLIFRNASVYDPYWSVQPIVILICFAIGKTLTLERILLLVAVCFWGVRLTANWAYTFHGLQHQDWRYTMLKEKTGIFYPIINFMLSSTKVLGMWAALCFSAYLWAQLFYRAQPIFKCTASAKTATAPLSGAVFGNTPATPTTWAKSACGGVLP